MSQYGIHIRNLLGAVYRHPRRIAIAMFQSMLLKAGAGSECYDGPRLVHNRSIILAVSSKHTEVTTLDSKIESSTFILNEMQCNLKFNYVNESEKNELKEQITSGKPFCCKYAMILWPNKVEV